MNIELIKQALEKRNSRNSLGLSQDEVRANTYLLMDSIPWLIGQIETYKAVLDRFEITAFVTEILDKPAELLPQPQPLYNPDGTKTTDAVPENTPLI